MSITFNQSGIDRLIGTLTEQRNAALDAVATLSAEKAMLVDQVNTLAQQVAELTPKPKEATAAETKLALRGNKKAA